MSNGRPPRWLEEQHDDPDVARAARLLGQVEEPVATPSARARVWGRLQEPAAPERSYGAWIGAAAAAAVAIAFFVMPRGTEPTNESEKIRLAAGQIEVSTTQEEPKTIAEPGKAVVGSRIKTKNKGGTLFILDVGELELAPKTEIALSRIDEGLKVELKVGALTSARPVSKAGRLKVIAGRWSVESKGAVVDVERIDNELDVVVTEGSARVRGPEVNLVLEAGERFSSDEADEAPATTVSAADPKQEEVAKKRRKKRRFKRRKSKRKSRATRKEPIEEAIALTPKTEEKKIEKIEKIETEAKVEPVPSTPDIPEPKRPDIPVTPDIPSTAPTEKTDTPVSPRPPSTEPKGKDYGRLYQLARRERSPVKAIALFDEVAASTHQNAPVAAYYAANRTMRIGRCREALSRFRRFIATYPRQALVREARLSIIECSMRLGDLNSAKGALESFLAAYPQSERNADLLFLRAELARKRNRCNEAIADYQRALQSKRRGDDALYFKAWCELQVGRKAAGQASLKQYLSRHPQGRHVKEARDHLSSD